jgi:DNA-binding transcriptional LysR family regulator
VGPRPAQTDAHVEVFGQEEVVVVAAAGHRFAAMSAVPMAAVADELFVHHAPSYGLAGWVDRLAAENRVALNPVLRTRNPRTAAELAGAGMGVTIVPVSALVPRPTGVIRRLRPMVKRDLIAMSFIPSDALVEAFIGDLQRRGLPHSRWPR